MPLYEYSCRQCRHTFEALVFNGDTVECPECHAADLQRLLSLPAKPKADSTSLPMSGCNSSGPPCGAPWCRRT
jgi:putative FmdB family regulatory protein